MVQKQSTDTCIKACAGRRDFEGVQKDNEKAVSEMKTLAESFEKEVTEEGELEPSARYACLQHLHTIKCSSPVVFA